MNELDQLSIEQLELLYEHRRLKEGGHEVQITTTETIDALRGVLGGALKERGVSNPHTLSLEALASQFADEDDREESIDVLADAGQQPETGGASEDEIDESGDDDPDEHADGVDVESLSPTRAEVVRDRVRKIERLEQRTPKHAANLKADLADDLECDIEDVPTRQDFKDVLDE